MGRKVNQNNLSIPEQILCVGDEWWADKAVYTAKM